MPARTPVKTRRFRQAGEQATWHAPLQVSAGSQCRRLARRRAGPATQAETPGALYAGYPRRFRRVVRLAQSAVFRQKPGPKPDRKAARRIAQAARRRARGTKWEELYQRFIPDYGKLNAITRGYAEDGLRRQVNKFLKVTGGCVNTGSHFPVTPPELSLTADASRGMLDEVTAMLPVSCRVRVARSLSRVSQIGFNTH
jgi:hypothetical protein